MSRKHGNLLSTVTASVAKNTLYLTIASVGQKALAFVYFIYLARTLGPEQTGVYFLSLSISTIFGVVADLGITPVVVREVAKRPEGAVDLVRRALGTKLPFLLMGMIGANLSAMALGYDPEIQRLVFLASFVMALDSIHLLYYGVLRGLHTLKFESLGIFVGMLMTVTFGGAVLIFDPRIGLLITALMIGSAFNVLFSTKQVVRQLGVRAISPEWDWEKTKTLMKIAFPFFLAGVFVKVYSYVDSIFLSKFIGTEAVGLYSVPYKITYAFQFLPMAFVAALYPGFSALVGKDHGRLARMFTDAMWYMIILASPIVFGIWAIAPDIILLAGEGYTSSGPVLAALVFVLIPIFLDFPVGSLLNAADRQATKTAIMGGTMVLNVVFNALLIPVYGIMGAAYAALISFSFLFLGGLYFIPQVIPTYRISRLAMVVTPILISGFVMGLVAVFLRNHIGFILTIPVAAVVYVAMLLLTRAVRKTHIQEAFRMFKRSSTPYATPSAHDD